MFSISHPSSPRPPNSPWSLPLPTARLPPAPSAPLLPIRIRDPRNNPISDVGPRNFDLGSLHVTTDLISHPGSTLGYRIEEEGRSLVFMPDHEVALGHKVFPGDPKWTSGFALAQGATLLARSYRMRGKKARRQRRER